MTLNYDDPIEGLGHFFEFIWETTEGFVYLPTHNRDTNEWKKVFYPWPKGREQVINHTLATSAKGLDIYFSPVLYSKANPRKEFVLGSNVIWADFDDQPPPSAWEGPRRAEGAIRPVGPESTPKPGEQRTARLGGSEVPAPSLRVQSSLEGREHVYWKLEEFNDDSFWIENSNRSIAYTLRADTGGWDIIQVLRPPYTTNYKRNLPVTIRSDSEIRFKVDDFSQLKPAIVLISDSIDTENLPIIEKVIAKYKWDDDHIELFMDGSIPEGKRSHALMRLGYFCAEAGMTDIEAYSIISNAAFRWEKFTGRTDRKKRLLDIINRARQKYPQALDNINFKGLDKQTDITTNATYVYGLQEFLASEVKVEWAIEDFMEKGGMGLIAAAPGVGKTQLSLQLAISCALGKRFLTWQPKEPMKIAVFSLEMHHVGLKLFLETIIKQYNNSDDLFLLQENLKVIPLGEALPLNNPQARFFIEKLLDDIQPDGIIFDSMAKLSMRTLDEEAAKSINTYLGFLRKKYNCFAWVIHHNRKASEGNKKPNSQEDIYGSTYVATDMSICLILWEEEDDLYLINVKNRYAKRAKTLKLIRNDNLHFQVESDSIGFDKLL